MMARSGSNQNNFRLWPCSCASTRMRAGLAVGVSLGGLSLFAGVAPAADELLAVPMGNRVEVFEISDLTAKRATAARLDARPRDLAVGRLRIGGVPRDRIGSEWQLGSRVLVRAKDLRSVNRAAGLGLATVRPIALSKDWYAIEADSIESAVRIAASLRGDPSIESVELDATPPFELRSLPSDPLLGDQWHLLNGFDAGVDVRAAGAWMMGYTGLGVTIGIVESGGFRVTHEDLAPLYNEAVSQPNDFISSHMTQVAGIAAGFGDNGVGVAGAAYNASLAQRLIGSNFQTSSALTAFNDVIDIKNNSWGPSDDGRFDFPSPLVMDAIRTAAETGRAGLGEIIVWAGGNGANASDRVDYDPYASSRYTIAVGAVGDDNIRSSYSEPGASLLVSAYSNGGSRGITTTQSNGGYTSNFGGTSAASPLAAGVIALMLEANPSLTWRDVQHILVKTSRVVSPNDEAWTVNGAGLLVNENYGFGLIDAAAAVGLAESWVTVGPELSATSGTVQIDAAIPDNDFAGVSRVISVETAVEIEAVELVLDVQTPAIGDLNITLVSPEGTASTLSRSRVDSQNDFSGTVFTSVRHWGERSDGDWTVRISDTRGGNQAFWANAEIRAFGADAGPGPCSAADMAEPFGVLDLADILAFVGAYQAQDSSADFAPPAGQFDEQDLSGFVTVFLAGCGS